MAARRNAAGLTRTADLTLEAWVKPSAVDANSYTVLAKAASGGAGTDRQYRLGMTSGQWRGTVYDTAGNPNTAVASTAPAVEVWQHLVFTVSGTTLTIYVN